MFAKRVTTSKKVVTGADQRSRIQSRGQGVKNFHRSLDRRTILSSKESSLGRDSNREKPQQVRSVMSRESR